MDTPKKSPVSSSAREAIHDQRTQMVLAQVARENAEMDARTARLKALRLAKEAQEAAEAEAPKPAAVKAPRGKKH